MTTRIAAFILAGSTSLSAVFAAEPPPAEAMLRLAPVMKDISVDTPESEHMGNLTVRPIKRKEVSGWQLVAEDRRVIRRFLDSNGDKKIDRWVYFLDGREVYRDADTDYDGIADTAIRKFQLKKDKDGKLAVATSERSSGTSLDEPSLATEPAVVPISKRKKRDNAIKSVEQPALGPSIQSKPRASATERHDSADAKAIPGDQESSRKPKAILLNEKTIDRWRRMTLNGEEFYLLPVADTTYTDTNSAD